RDAETGEEVWVNTLDRKFTKLYSEYVIERQNKFIKEARAMNLDLVQIDAGKSYVEPLVKFFKMRERRFR
ncbi:MAG: DUF58 domain-containing protein, partial [Candidatus Neomarinimicrobiota bacterium]